MCMCECLTYSYPQGVGDRIGRERETGREGERQERSRERGRERERETGGSGCLELHTDLDCVARSVL